MTTPDQQAPTVNQRAKILYVITKSNWGGAQRYVYDLATGLSKEKYDTEVVLGGDGPLSVKLREAGIPVTSLPGLARNVSVGKDTGVFWSLLKIFREKKPDVVHLNSSKIGALGAVAAHLAGIRFPTKKNKQIPRTKIIFTAHGWAFNENRSAVSKTLIKFISWLTIMLCHQTIAVSEHMRSKTLYWPIVRNKIIVIHNGVSSVTGFSAANARLELTRQSAALKAEIAHAHKNYSEKDIVWLGTIAELHHIKGHETTLRALKEYITGEGYKKATGKKILYAIIGEGEERAALENLIKELELTDTVFLLGHMDGAAQYIKAFDIFILASLSEGLGYVILEAGMAEVGCIATAVGGIPEIISDMKSGILVQPQRPKEIAHAIDYLIENKGLAKEYAAALHAKVAAEFSIEQMIAKTEALY
jgi:glycosyltransferase involved in cell wall biosynthesis